MVQQSCGSAAKPGQVTFTLFVGSLHTRLVFGLGNCYRIADDDNTLQVIAVSLSLLRTENVQISNFSTVRLARLSVRGGAEALVCVCLRSTAPTLVMLSTYTCIDHLIANNTFARAAPPPPTTTNGRTFAFANARLRMRVSRGPNGGCASR